MLITAFAFYILNSYSIKIPSSKLDGLLGLYILTGLILHLFDI